MWKNFPETKPMYQKNALFVLSRAPTHQFYWSKTEEAEAQGSSH